MKKVYVQPEVEIIGAELELAIAASYQPKGDHGSEGKYANSEWVNEGHSSTTNNGFDLIDIEDDTQGRSSRSNTSIWE
jgi:hypothetical protein